MVMGAIRVSCLLVVSTINSQDVDLVRCPVYMALGAIRVSCLLVISTINSQDVDLVR